MSDPGGAGAAPPASGGTTPPPPPAGSEASRSRGAAPPRAGAAASPFASAGPAVTVQWASGGSSPAPAEPSPSDDGFRSGPHLALQASLQRRPSSAAASELYPPHGGSRPTSAASHRSGASGGGGMGRAPSLHASGSRPLAPAPRPSLRGGPPSEAGSAQSAAVLLESVRSQLQEAAGPGGACECRVLLPGLDLAEHGLGELQELAAPGGCWPGIELRRAEGLGTAVTGGVAALPWQGLLRCHPPFNPALAHPPAAQAAATWACSAPRGAWTCGRP